MMSRSDFIAHPQSTGVKAPNKAHAIAVVCAGQSRGKRIRCPLRLIVVFLLGGCTASTALEQAPQLTVERIASWPQLSGTSPAAPTWSPRSDQLAFLWNDRGRPFHDVWVVDVPRGVPKRITNLEHEVAPVGEPVAVSIGDLNQAAYARADPGVSEVIWTTDGASLVFGYRGDMFRIAPDGTALTRLGGPKGAKHAFQFSKDGRFLSFLQGGDLWLWNQRSDELVRATDMGRAPLGGVPGGAQGGPDVEFSLYQWSPDSRYVALQYENRQRVRKQIIPNYLTEETSIVTVRRERLGEGDAIQAIALYSIDEKRTEFVKISDDTGRRIGDMRWSPDGKRLLVDQSSADAAHRWLYIVQPDTGSVQEVWHDYRSTRPTRHWTSEWHSDGQGVIFVSDVDDRHHLYSLRLGESQPRRLTKGDWSILGEAGKSVLTVAGSTGQVFFVSTMEGPEQRQVYSIPESGGTVTRVTYLPGVHLPVVAPDGLHVASLHSNDVTPTELYLVSAEDGGPERRITQSPPADFYDYEWVQPRYVRFPSRSDGATLSGRLLLPPHMDAGKKYPVIIGPVYSNSVRNRWLDRESQKGFYSTLQHFLAMKGYIGLQVDVRGSVGHGRQFRERILTDFGGIDVEDLHSGVEYLKTLPYVDSNRIGIWGTSYGGLMTTLSLFTKPGVYAAAVACAPVTNMWHARPGVSGVMRHPQAHPEDYQEGSSIHYAEGLQDPLLIMHGMLDDIVLFHDTVILIEKLMLLGKNFDLAVAPSAVHHWEKKDYVAAHLLRKLVSHFDTHLQSNSD